LNENANGWLRLSHLALLQSPDWGWSGMKVRRMVGGVVARDKIIPVVILDEKKPDSGITYLVRLWVKVNLGK
jgi:hypothetical protein